MNSLGVVGTLGIQKMGKNIDSSGVAKLSEFKKQGNINSLGVVGTLGIQKMGKKLVWVLQNSRNSKNKENILVWVLWELSEFRKWGKH